MNDLELRSWLRRAHRPVEMISEDYRRTRCCRCQRFLGVATVDGRFCDTACAGWPPPVRRMTARVREGRGVRGE